MTKVTRRGLIQAAALVPIVAITIPPLPSQDETWSWDTGQETFHFIGYTHYSDTDGAKLFAPDPEREFAEVVDGIFMEDVDDYLNPKHDTVHQIIAEGNDDDMFRFGLTYKYCREKRVPLFLGDLSFKPEGELALKIAAAVIPGAEVLGGSTTAIVAASQTMNRRRFALAGVSLGLSALGASSSAVRLLTSEGGRKNLQEAETQTKRDLEATLSDRIHPENIVIVGRNALWAKKLFFLGEELRKRGIKHPNIGIIGGFEHRYLDFFLRHPNEIDGVLSIHKGLVENAVASKDYLYKILELRFREGSFTKQILRVPELERTYLEKETTAPEAKG